MDVKQRFYWIFCCLLLLPTISKAQSIAPEYQLEIHSSQNLQEAIDLLADQYRIDFAYSPEVLQKQQLEPGRFSAFSIDALLRQLLANRPVQYRILSEDRVLLRGIDLKESAGPLPVLKLEGRVIDEATGQSMMNVAIALDTLHLGALTDENGAFSLSLPAGLSGRSVWVYHIGYKTKFIPVARLSTMDMIRLSSEPLSLSEVLIIGRLPPVNVRISDGNLVLRGEGLQGGMASQLAGKDVFRQVQLMAGINADNDLSSDIRIRGSNADETLIILDGMPLYKVDHFYGVFSALNGSYLQEAQLYKNALPIQYGGRTGGMLLLKSVDELSGFHGELDLNLLSAGLQADIPLTSTIGLSLSGRRSHTNVAASKFFDWVGKDVDFYIDRENLFTRPDILETEPEFGFSDWNAKLLIQPGENDRLSVNFYRSTDHFLNSYSNSFEVRRNREWILNEELFSDQQDWKNTAASVQYFSQLGSKWKLEAEGFYAGYQSSGAFSSQIFRYNPDSTIANSLISNDQFNKVENAGYRIVLNKEFSPGRVLQLGSSGNAGRTEFAVNSEADTLLANRAQGFDSQLFGSYQWSPIDKWQWTAGARLGYYNGTGKFYFSPRITTSYKLDQDLHLKASYSTNYQYIREITHENRLGQSIDLVLLSNNDRFPVGRSDNFMLGANWKTRHWMFDLELYHKKLANVIDHSSLSLSPGEESPRPALGQQYRLFVGEGAVNGLDATIAWDFPVYSGQVAYTLSKATDRFPEILRGTPVPSRDDRRHQLKWINSWKIGRFDFSANFIYSSGKPYYDLRSIPRGEADRRTLRLRQFVSWLPAYLRMDAGLAYRFNIGPTKAKLGLSVFNLTNHRNVKYLQFIYSIRSEENNLPVNSIIGSQTDLLDRTLNLSFGFEF